MFSTAQNFLRPQKGNLSSAPTGHAPTSKHFELKASLAKLHQVQALRAAEAEGGVAMGS